MDTVDLPALTKGLSLLTGLLVIICAIVFMAAEGTYLSVVVGLETMIFAAVQLVIEVQAPDFLIDKFRDSLPMMLSAPGQLFLSVLMALFLFAMGGFGIAMAVITICVVGLNAYTMATYPDIMPNRYGDVLEPPEEPQYAQPPFAAPYPDAAKTYSYNPTQPQAQPSTADL